MMKLRFEPVSAASSPKLWARLIAPGDGSYGRQVAEFDLGDGKPGRMTALSCDGMTGMVWPRGEISGVNAIRKPYRDRESWVAEVLAEYPGCRVIRAD